MKRIASILAVVLAVAASAQDLGTGDHRVVWVDQDGNTSVTNALARQADLAALAASNRLAVARQRASEAGYAAATQLLNEVANTIVAGSPIVFCSLELVSFEAAAVFDEATSNVRVCDFRVLGETEERLGTTCVKTEMSFVFFSTDGRTIDLQGVKPLVPYNETVDGRPTGQWDFLNDALVDAPVAHSGTVVVDGREYSNYYTMSVWIPQDRAHGFFRIRVPNDAAVGDGNTLDTPGDAGGWNGTLVFGENRLPVVNGRIMATREEGR